MFKMNISTKAKLIKGQSHRPSSSLQVPYFAHIPGHLDWKSAAGAAASVTGIRNARTKPMRSIEIRKLNLESIPDPLRLHHKTLMLHQRTALVCTATWPRSSCHGKSVHGQHSFIREVKTAGVKDLDLGRRRSRLTLSSCSTWFMFHLVHGGHSSFTLTSISYTPEFRECHVNSIPYTM